jgi:L-seryl-tRNA(Ser) seleniumtransferase
VPLAEVIALAKARSVPVIVDMASEYDLKGPIGLGAAIAVYSAHKFLGGPTAGIVAGRTDLIRACHLQNRGIGRTMKVGKEGVLGTIAALEAWAKRDHSAVSARELAILAYWQAQLEGLPGLRLIRHPDWTGNPIDRLELTLRADASLFAWELADRLAMRDPSIQVRDDHVERGLVYLDPCNLKSGEEALVAAAICAELEAARSASDGRRLSVADWRARRRQELTSLSLTRR